MIRRCVWCDAVGCICDCLHCRKSRDLEKHPILVAPYRDTAAHLTLSAACAAHVRQLLTDRTPAQIAEIYMLDAAEIARIAAP